MSGERHLLWDIPTRVFHWSLVIAIVLAWFSAETERYEMHEWVGYSVIVLIITRILWGLVGSRHSRFSDFVAGPVSVARYLRGDKSPTPGHNPAGGWSVLVLLSLMLLQAVSGLFNTDDVFYSGPLHYWAESSLRDSMGAIHDWSFNVLLAVVGLHILAVCFYQFRRGEPLVQAMVKGRAEGKAGEAPPASPWLALVLVAIVALLLWWGLDQAPQPEPMQWM